MSARTLPAAVDVVVVGGGINGVICAAELAGRGVRVLVVEKEARVGAEASGRSFGSLRVQGRHPAELPLALDAAGRWAAAAQTIGADFEFVRGGNLYLAETEAEVPMLRDQLALAHEAGLRDVRLLGPAATRDLVPALAGHIAAALYSPQDAHCDPRKAVQAYAALADRSGATVALGTRVRAVLADRAVRGIATDRGEVRAERVVVAAGVWTAALLRGLGLRLPIKPVVYTNAETSPCAPLLRATVRALRWSCRQRPSGELVVGSGLNARVVHRVSLADLSDVRLWWPRFWANRRQVGLALDGAALAREVRAWIGGAPPIPVAEEPPADVRQLENALAALKGQLPQARETRLTRCWGGVLDLAPDGLPVIERLDRPEGLTVAAGLSGHGLAIAPAVGRVLADLALDGKSAHDLSPFRLNRFAEPVPLPARLV